MLLWVWPLYSKCLWTVLTSDVNKDWTHKDQDKDKDQSHKDKDFTHKDKDKHLTYKDSKQKRRQAQHSFFKTVSLNVFKKHWNTK